MKRNQVLCWLGALMLALAPATRATLLSPPVGTLEPPPGIDFASSVLASPDPASSIPDHTADSHGTNPIGALIAGSTGLENINTGLPGSMLSRSFSSELYQEVSGTLDFYYQVSIAPTSKASLDALDVSSFLASSVGSANVNLRDAHSLALADMSGTTGVPGACEFGANPACAPTVTVASPDKGMSAPMSLSYDSTGTLYFTWSPPAVFQGGTPSVLVVSTVDTLFGLGATSLIGTNGTSQDLSSFQPLLAPEPVSLVLLGTAVALAALFIRRRHVAKVSKAEIKAEIKS